MNADLERLVVVHRLDQKMARLAHAVKAAQDHLSAAQQRRDRAQTEATQQEAATHSAKGEERRLQRELDEVQRSEHQAKDALATGAGGAAAERQLARARSVRDDLETRLLELLESQEAAAVRLQAAQAALHQAEQQVVQAQQGVVEAEQRRKEQLPGLQAERPAALGVLEVGLRQKYQTLAGLRGGALSRVVEGECKACAKRVQPGQRSELSRDLLVNCHGCGRFLVPDHPDLADL